MTRKIFQIFVSIIVIIMLMCGQMVAALTEGSANSAQQKTIYASSQIMNIDLTVSSLSISAGRATALGRITGVQGLTDYVQILLILETYRNGTWNTLTSWSRTFNSYYGSLIGSVNISNAGVYRVRAYFAVYSGMTVERAVKFSNTVIYVS